MNEANNDNNKTIKDHTSSRTRTPIITESGSGNGLLGRLRFLEEIPFGVVNVNDDVLASASLAFRST